MRTDAVNDVNNRGLYLMSKGILNRAKPRSVALETTLLVHGVPRDAARPLAAELETIIRDAGAFPVTIGVVNGRPIVGMSENELALLLDAPAVPKANSSNLGALIHRGSHAATTVSATMELASAAGVRVFGTGGLGGAHRGYGDRWDVSSDLAALARFPVVVVASGVKNLLDVDATREMLESLGVPVIGYKTDHFPAFYLRAGASGVDARFDDEDKLASYADAELTRTGRGVLICNPIAPESELDPASWASWREQAEQEVLASGVRGRDVTPAVLTRVHALSGGATLQANLALVRANAGLAGRLAAQMTP